MPLAVHYQAVLVAEVLVASPEEVAQAGPPAVEAAMALLERPGHLAVERLAVAAMAATARSPASAAVAVSSAHLAHQVVRRVLFRFLPEPLVQALYFRLLRED